MIEKGLFQLVTQDAGVKAAVGTDANGTTRAYWVLAPQGTPYPVLVFSRIATSDIYTMEGTTGLRNSLFQIACYASTYYTSRVAAAVVRKLLQDYTGTLPDGTVVQSVMVEKDFDAQYEEGGTGWIYGAYLQFRIWFEE